jgi:hypothetical protein
VLAGDLSSNYVMDFVVSLLQTLCHGHSEAVKEIPSAIAMTGQNKTKTTARPQRISGQQHHLT